MKTRPMLFNADMVSALLEGRKTQTRRPIKLPKDCLWLNESDGTWTDTNLDNGFWHCEELSCPYGEVGDLLWVRETASPDFPKDFSYYDNTWAEVPDEYKKPEYVLYKASHQDFEIIWKPSIHMPRWASRLTLEITNVRVERLQDISEEDAIAEGLERSERFPDSFLTINGDYAKPKVAFMRLWDSIYGNWNENPWVWVIEFKVHHCNVDELKGVEL